MTRRFAGCIQKIYDTLLKGALIGTLILGPNIGYSADPVPTDTPLEAIIPKVEGVDLETLPTNAEGEPDTLPAPLEKIAQEKANAANAAPAWVKELRSRSIGEYFPQTLDDKSEAWQQGKRRLLDDAQKLHKYFEEQDQSGLYQDFIDKKLTPFINTLDAKKVSSAVREQRITRPIKEWTVETLVVTEQVA
ncbi:MAG: hypothetical protein ACXWRE_10860, partial [Pseudobdellovibrionaceae bacterium]